MMIWLLLLIGTLGIGALVAAILDHWLWRQESSSLTKARPGYRLALTVANTLFGLGFLIFVSPIFYEYPGVFDKKIPVTFRGDEIIKHPYGCFEWPWQRTVNIREVFASERITTSLMTDNPKVRKLNYSVTLAMANPEQYFRVKERRGRNDLFESEAIRKQLGYQLYEFNDRAANELVRFYNPESVDQQASFLKLVKDYFDPIFAEDGLAVSQARFSLAD